MHTAGTTFPVSAGTTASLFPDESPAVPAPQQLAQELMDMARQAEDWRTRNGLTLRQFFKRAHTLNDKTHGKLLAGDLTGLIPANHIPKYRQALRDLDNSGSQQQSDPILPGLTPTRLVHEGVCSLRLQGDLERFMLVEGESGFGKSTALRYVAQQDADSILVCAHQGWSRPLQAISDLLRTSGFSGDLPNSFAACHQEFIRRLAAKPRLLCIDEGQHMEITILNVLKDVINRTGCRVVVATMASLWRKIQARHWPEVQQLLLNRMHLRITLTPPGAEEVRHYLAARLELTVPQGKGRDAEPWTRALSTITSGARSNGGMAYVRKTVNAARLIAGQQQESVGPEHLTTAAHHVSDNTRGFDR